MHRKISLDWDKIRANGSIKKKKDKYTPFVSRNSPYCEQKTTRADRLAEQIANKKRSETCGNGGEIQRDKNGKYFYQPRVNGRFGKRVEISESLAKKLI